VARVVTLNQVLGKGKVWSWGRRFGRQMCGFCQLGDGDRAPICSGIRLLALGGLRGLALATRAVPQGAGAGVVGATV
jgi:hypothetical protein